MDDQLLREKFYKVYVNYLKKVIKVPVNEIPNIKFFYSIDNLYEGTHLEVDKILSTSRIKFKEEEIYRIKELLARSWLYTESYYNRLWSLEEKHFAYKRYIDSGEPELSFEEYTEKFCIPGGCKSRDVYMTRFDRAWYDLDFKNCKPKYIDVEFRRLFNFMPEIWDKTDLKNYRYIVKHRYYNFLLLLGFITWVTLLFWGPFVLATYLEARTFLQWHFVYHKNYIMDIERSGIALFFWFAFASPVLFPFNCFMGAIVHPWFLTKTMFGKRGINYEYLKIFKQDVSLSKSIAAGTMGELALSRYFSNKGGK